jgi:hypothetical protein
MTIRKPAAVGVVAASLAVGGLAGATLFAPQFSGAQEDTTTEDTPVEATEDAPAEDRAGPKERMGGRLENLAGLLGVTGDELRDALRDGQSIAEVAEANGVDPQTVIDELTEQARARIEEKLAELPTRIEDFVNGEFEGRGPGFGGPGGRGPFGQHPHPGEATESGD